MSYRLSVSLPGEEVQAWSTVRLPFEPKAWLRDFRRDLAEACRGLVAAPGQLLHAVYGSADSGLVDIENVLTYNLAAVLRQPELAPLGRTRLVVPRGSSRQWLPDDDRIVALDLRRSLDEPPGTITVDTWHAAPTTVDQARHPLPDDVRHSTPDPIERHTI